MKSEPDVYSIQVLEKESKNGGSAMWEGCRNYTVRNFFRDRMKEGDLAFFYHSNSTPTGIVGSMEVVGTAYPDPTQFDPASEYYDPKSTKESPRWLARNVRLVRIYDRIITLADIRGVPSLGEMLVIQRGQRLSVMPVTPEEWRIIESLV